MITKQKRFLLVDDDPENNLLSRIALKKSLGEAEVMDFTFPESALEYIKDKFVFNLQPLHYVFMRKKR